MTLLIISSRYQVIFVIFVRNGERKVKLQFTERQLIILATMTEGTLKTKHEKMGIEREELEEILSNINEQWRSIRENRSDNHYR